MNGVTFDNTVYAVAVLEQMSIAESRMRVREALSELHDTARKAQALLESGAFPRVAFYRAAPGLYAYVRRVGRQHRRGQWRQKEEGNGR